MTDTIKSAPLDAVQGHGTTVGLGLIARLQEAAKDTAGPDRDLDADIWWLIDRDAAKRFYWNATPGLPKDPPINRPHIGLGAASLKQNAPRYTSSIDAALTLVPPHHLWELRQGFEARAIVWRIEVDYDDRAAPTGYAACWPAIALCIAALKASLEAQP